MLVFVPLAAAELQGWAGNGQFAPSEAFAVTPSLQRAFGFSAADDEDAEHTALHVAGLAALLRTGRRLVAVAESPARAVTGSEFGEVEVAALPWTSVNALFADDPAGAAAATGIDSAGSALADAWDDPGVADLLASHELLWHGPSEWAVLAR